MSDWISMATTFSEMVDCRMVQLELEFHQVTRGQLVELAPYLTMVGRMKKSLYSFRGYGTICG